MSISDEEGLAALASRRLLPSGLYLAWCFRCGCEMSVDTKTLVDEFRGSPPLCHSCGSRSGGGPASRAFTQESHDIAYHGGRFHGGEW
jgi:hypothetical protein